MPESRWSLDGIVLLKSIFGVLFTTSMGLDNGSKGEMVLGTTSRTGIHMLSRLSNYNLTVAWTMFIPYILS